MTDDQHALKHVNHIIFLSPGEKTHEDGGNQSSCVFKKTLPAAKTTVVDV